MGSSPRCCRYGYCLPRAVPCRPSSRSARWRSWLSASSLSSPTSRCLRSPVLSTAPVRFGRAAFSRSCSSRSPAEPCRVSHSLIASGTTPKMLENESQVRMIGYGAMLTESFVAMMALIGATVLEPGVYFVMNSPAGLIGTTAVQAAQVVTGWGFTITPDMISQVAQDVGEKTLLSRTGGAPTLGGGMAGLLSGMFGGRAMMGIWYHFAILFEALFILTTVDAGTRVARFMIQDMIGSVVPSFKQTQSWSNNVIGSALARSEPGVTSSIKGSSIRWVGST